MGDIGEPLKTIEFEPMPKDEPLHEPDTQPAPALPVPPMQPVPA